MVDNANIVPLNKRSRKIQIATPLDSVAYFDGQHENSHSGVPSLAAIMPVDYKQAKRRRKKIRLDNIQRWHVEIYADALKVVRNPASRANEPRDNTFRGGGRRGMIRGFSRASRKRMIEFMAKIRNVNDVYFLTVTYPDLFPPDDEEAWHADFEAFRHRFQRKYPGYRALWRMELVARKSGDNEGEIAPHFHMIVFTDRRIDDETDRQTAKADFWGWCSNSWFEIANYEDERHLLHGTDCQILQSRRMAYGYVSKYIGKEATDGLEVGRRWGRIGKFDTSKSETFRLTDAGYIELRRLVKRWLKNRKSSFARSIRRCSASTGLTVFGMGDTLETGQERDIFAPYWQFIDAARRTASDRSERERSHGD